MKTIKDKSIEADIRKPFSLKPSLMNRFTERTSQSWLRVFFFLPNGRVEFTTVKFKVNKTFDCDKCMYVMDEKFVYFDKNVPYIFYMKDNPNPIKMTDTKLRIKTDSNPEGIVMTADAFFEVMNTKVIKEIAGLGVNQDILLILVGVCVLLGVVNFLLSSGMVHIGAAPVVNETVNATTKFIVQNATKVQ